LPVLPRLNGGRAEHLMMVKTGAPLPVDERLVLRLWRSDVTVSVTNPVPIRLWVGTVIAERIKPIYELAVITSETRDMNVPVRSLADALPAARLVRRHEAEGYPNWDGTVLLGGDQALGSPFKPDSEQR